MLRGGGGPPARVRFFVVTRSSSDNFGRPIFPHLLRLVWWSLAVVHLLQVLKYPPLLYSYILVHLIPIAGLGKCYC